MEKEIEEIQFGLFLFSLNDRTEGIWSMNLFQPLQWEKGLRTTELVNNCSFAALHFPYNTCSNCLEITVFFPSPWARAITSSPVVNPLFLQA